MSEKPNSGITIENLTVIYRNGHIGLKNASFQIPTGTITALVGVNGAGKSTLFKSIMGFLPISSGEINVLGLSVQVALKQNIIAYVPQAEEVDWSFPVLVKDVVMMGRYGHMGFFRNPKPADHDAVKNALARVNMSAFSDRQIGELSGGQRKRVFLARALAQNSKIILLDEPFTGVDVQTEDAIINLLLEMKNEGRIMLVSTHNLGSVPEFCDRAILIKQTVLAHGPTKATFTRENLELAFGGVLRHFVLGGSDLHEDDDQRAITVITDDERPFVLYDNEKQNNPDD